MRSKAVSAIAALRSGECQPLHASQLFRALAKDLQPKIKHAFKPTTSISSLEIESLCSSVSFKAAADDAHAVLTALSRLRLELHADFVLRVGREGIAAALADGQMRTAARICSLLGVAGVQWSVDEVRVIKGLIMSVCEELEICHEEFGGDGLGYLCEAVVRFDLSSDEFTKLVILHAGKMHIPPLAILQISRFLAFSGERSLDTWRLISRETRKNLDCFTARDLCFLLSDFAAVCIYDVSLVQKISLRLHATAGSLSFSDCMSVAASLESLGHSDAALISRLQRRLYTTSLVSPIAQLSISPALLAS